MHKFDILAISYAYTPYNWPRSIQLSRLLPELADLGKSIYLITNIVDEDNQRFDASLREIGCHQNIEINRVGLPIYLRFLKILTRFIPFLRKIPDDELIWSLYVAFRYFLTMRKNKINNLITFSNPLSDHIFGLINRNLFENWIAHFSDPWNLNIYENRTGFHKYINIILEKKVFKSATSIAFASVETLNAYSKHFLGKFDNKLNVITHIKPKINPSKPRFLKIAKFMHFGSLYGAREPSTIFELIVQLKDKLKNNKEKKFVFQFFGDDGKRYTEDLCKLEISEFVDFYEAIPYGEAIKLMGDSQCLVLLDANSHDGNVFIASKLVDYWSYINTPILAITPLYSASNRLLAKHGQKTFEHRVSKELINYTLSIIEGTMVKNNRSKSWNKEFSGYVEAKKLIALLR